MTERLVPGRDIGGQVSGEFDFGTKKKIEYAVGIFNGAGINVDDDNECKDIAGRILIFPIQDLSVGVSYYNGKSGAAETDKLRTGMELSYLINRLSIEGEYISGKDGNLEEYGWYAQIGYKFVPELEAVVKYDSYEPDKNKTDDKIDAATLGLNWVLNKWAKIQTNYEWKFEEGTKVSNDVFLTQYQVQF
ncbi:hypothetical protein HY792_02005 [Candidatus Desantisbacteria bacterium]|nr:hypothetical protein [Candidatus Desantisbacteria bacterium]